MGRVTIFSRTAQGAMRRILGGLLSMLLLAAAARALPAAEGVEATYADRLRTLAETLDQAGKPTAADAVRAWGEPLDPARFYPVLPESLTSFPESVAEADALKPYYALRREQADELYQSAVRAAGQGEVALAYHSLWNALRENPDHAAARKALGYQRFDGRWLTRYETEKHRAGQIWHAEFGWLPKDHVARYEAGERFYLGRWIAAEKEAELRRELARGWQVQTEHYLVKTNHSLEAGVRLARRLERLHMAWRQLFVAYYATPRQMAEAFVRKPLAAPGAGRRQVVLYRDRAEYLAELRSVANQIEMTTGIYLGDKRTAYFFAGEEEDIATQYHEATHQLFGESRPTAQGVGRDGNFWFIEGIACYMESLAEHGGRWSTGGLEAYRVQAARQRLLDDKFYVPLAELTAMGMLDIQQHPQIRSIYSQSTGLAQLLMHGVEGKHREAAIQYLLAIYTGRDRPSSLQELTGEEYSKLDAEYTEMMAPPIAPQSK
jgi:hypothetical protein